MMDFFDDALAGTLFFIFGLWHLLNVFYYHIKFKGAQQNHSKKHVIAHTLRFPCQDHHVPLEGIVKLILCTIGMVAQGYGVVQKNAEKCQYFTIYTFFCFSGLIDILMFYGVSIPEKFDYFVHIISFSAEGLQFNFPIRDKLLLGVTLHKILVYLCYLNAVAVIGLMVLKRRLILHVFFGVCLLVHGSWLFHVGYIIYVKNMSLLIGAEMKISAIFCWHLFLNTVFVFLLFMVMTKIVKPCDDIPISRYENLDEDSDLEKE